MAYRYTMPPALTDTDLNLERYKLNPPAEWISGRDTLTRYTRTRLSAWFATEEIPTEDSFKELEKELKKINPPLNFTMPDYSKITANNAYTLLGEYNKLRALLNRPPSVLIPLTAGPSKATYLKDEEYSVVFSIDDTGTVEFHIKPIKQEITIELLEGEVAPRPSFEGISPTLKNGNVEYNAKFKVCVLPQVVNMLLYRTIITRTNRYPDVVFDGKPQTITLPLPSGEWKYNGKPLKKGNSISIESIPNPDRKDLSLKYEFKDASDTLVTIYVNIINNFPCKRCGKTYNRAENRHGACVWHPGHGRRWHQEYEASLETLSKYVPKTAIKVDKQKIDSLIAQDKQSQLLQQINVKLAHIEQKYGVVYNLSDISTRTIGEIKVIIDNHLADSSIPYDLTRIMKRLFTIETVEQILNPLYFDFSDVATHPQSNDERNPNKHYGFYNGTWLCCGQTASKGCLTGWHSSTNDEPTFTHIAFHDAPIQCTEYINDPNTSSEVFYRAVDTYRRGDKIGTIQLEMLQNRIHGAQLRIRFTKKDSTRDFEMRTNVLTGADFTGEKLQDLLKSEMENNSKLQKIWIRDRSDALSFPNGTNQRYITDTNYIDRLIAVVELVNDSKNIDSTVAKTNLENKLQKIFPTAALKVALTPEQQRIKTEIDTILQKLESNVKQLEKNKVTLQTFKTSWDTIIDKLKRSVWGDSELKIADSVTLPVVMPIIKRLTPIDEKWVVKFKNFKNNQDYTDANKIMLENLLKKNPISKLDLSDIEKTLRETKDRLNTYLQSRDTLFAAFENTLNRIFDKLNPAYEIMKSKYDALSSDLKSKIDTLDVKEDNAAIILKRALPSKRTLLNVIKSGYITYYNILNEIRPKYETATGIVITSELIQKFPNRFVLTSTKMKELYKLLGLANEDEIQEVLAAYKPWKDEFEKLLILYDTDGDVKKKINEYIGDLSELVVRQDFENTTNPEETKRKLVESPFWINTINGLYVKLLESKLSELNEKAINLETIAIDTSLLEDADYENVSTQYAATDTQLSALKSQSDIIQYSDRFFEPLETAIDEYQKKLETSIDKVYAKFEALRDELKVLNTVYTSPLPKPKVDLTTPDNTIDAYNAVKEKLGIMPAEKTEIEQRITIIKSDIDENFTAIDEIVKTNPEDVKKAIDLVKEEYLTKVSVQELTAFLDDVIQIRNALITDIPLEMSEMEQKRQAFRNEVYQPITGGTEENLLFKEMQTEVIKRIQTHPVLTKINKFITGLKLGDIKYTDLDNSNEWHLIIGALKDLGNPETGAKLLLYHFVRPGKIEYKEDKYERTHLIDLYVNEESWKAAIAEQQDIFALNFLEVVKNIGALLKPLQTAVDALKSKKETKSGTGEKKAPARFDVLVDRWSLNNENSKKEACLLALRNMLREKNYNIVIGNERWTGDNTIDKFKPTRPTFFVSWNIGDKWIADNKETVDNIDNLFFIDCGNDTTPVPNFTHMSAKKIAFLEKLSNEGGTEPAFVTFKVVYDSDIKMVDLDQCFGWLQDHLKLTYNIVLENTIPRTQSTIEDFKALTFFVCNKSKIADVDTIRKQHSNYLNTFVVNVRSSNQSERDFPKDELVSYKNTIPTNVKLIGGGADRFESWLQSEGFKYVLEDKSPQITFTITDKEKTLSVNGNIITVPYSQTRGVVLFGKISWSNYDIVISQIPALRTAILTLLANRYAPKPRAPPVTKPPETSTTEPGAEETTTEESLKKETEEKKSEKKEPPVRVPLIPDLKYNKFENLKAGMEDPANQSRAWLTVQRIRDQIAKQNDNFKTVLQCKASVGVINPDSGLPYETKSAEMKYNNNLLNYYYVWTLMLYALHDSKISRSDTFIELLQSYCATDSSIPYASVLSDNRIIDAFETDRKMRLIFLKGEKLMTKANNKKANDTKNERTKSAVLEFRKKLSKISSIDITPLPTPPLDISAKKYADVPFWVWQPSIFYAYYALSIQLQDLNLRIETDLWVCNVIGQNDVYPIFNTTSTELNEILDQRTKYRDDIVETYLENIERSISKDVLAEVPWNSIPSYGTGDRSGNNVLDMFKKASTLHFSQKWRKEILYPVYKTLLQIPFRLPENLVSTQTSVIYAFFKNNTVHGHSKLDINYQYLDHDSKNQMMITEIVAYTHGRLLYIRMYLDAFLFRTEESTPQLLYLEPNRRLQLLASDTLFPDVKMQMFSGVPSELLETYSRWGFMRNFKVEDVDIMNTVRYADLLLPTSEAIANLKKDPTHIEKHIANAKIFCALFNCDMDANKIIKIASKFNPANITTYPPSFVAFCYLLGIRLLEVNGLRIEDVSKPENGAKLMVTNGVRANVNLAVHVNPNPTYYGVFAQLKSWKHQYKENSFFTELWLRTSLGLKMIDNLTAPQKEQMSERLVEHGNIAFWMLRKPRLSGQNMIYDIAEIPLTYKPMKLSKEQPSQVDFTKAIEDQQKNIDAKFESMAHSNLEKYVFSIIDIQSITDQSLTSLKAPVNVNVLAAIEFLRSLGE